MTISVGNHIGTGKSVRNNDGRFAEDFLDKVTDEVSKCFSGIISHWVVREAKAQQIDRIDTELLGQDINILPPLIRRGPRSEAMDEQERLCFTGSLDLIVDIAIFPGIAALFAILQ